MDPTDRHSHHISLRSELTRKFVHIAFSAIPLSYYLLPQPFGILGLILATTSLVLVDILRLRWKRVSVLFTRCFGGMLRGGEDRDLLGSSYYVMSACVCVLVFEQDIALSALANLVIGDSVAALVGRRFGGPRFGDKSLAGSIACFTACMIVGLLIIRSSWIVLAGALVATIAEAAPVSVNDNIRVPILSGLVMQVIRFSTQG